MSTCRALGGEVLGTRPSIEQMLRRALLFSVALAGTIGSADASAARTTIPIRGNVVAIALAGDTLIVARQPRNRGSRLERITPGASARTLLRLPRSKNETEVALAASAQALAFSTQTDAEDGFSTSHVYVGSPAGSLRDVAACAAGIVLPPVAVSGARIAWREGGCGQPATGPRGVGPASILIGGPDPASPLRRVAVGPDALPASIVLNGETGFAGVLRPSFFSVDSEVRRLEASALGETLAAEQGRIVAPVGVLSSGDGVFLLGARDEDGEVRAGCDATVFVLHPGNIQRRTLPVGGCLIGSGFAGATSRVAGDRVLSLVVQRRSRKSKAPPPVALTSVRGDGADARVLARGTYRPPRAFAVAESGRLAWFQQGCAGGAEIVVDEGATPATASSIPSCTVKLLDRSARVRGGRITLRLRCPSGCSGSVIGATRLERLLGDFSFSRGTHRLRLRLTRSEGRRNRLRLNLEVREGPARSAVIRLR